MGEKGWLRAWEKDGWELLAVAARRGWLKGGFPLGRQPASKLPDRCTTAFAHCDLLCYMLCYMLCCVLCYVLCYVLCRDYLDQLLRYLLSYYERTQPLGQVHKQLQKMQEEVEAGWKEGQVRVGGWGAGEEEWKEGGNAGGGRGWEVPLCHYAVGLVRGV